MNEQFLFRGVSSGCHDANHGILRPKVQEPFSYNFHWGESGATWGSGIMWGSTTPNAVIRHQLNQEGFPTAGISTTPHFERAIAYARGKGGNLDGFVYKIDRSELNAYGVTEFIVAEYCKPSLPEDDAVILVTSNGEKLPKELVVEVITISFA